MDIYTMKSKVNLGCSNCKECCMNRGDIRLTPLDVIRISKFLKISIDEFLYNYTKKVSKNSFEIVLKGYGKNSYCVCYDKESQRCKIHSVKPVQCVMFPLVPENSKRDYFCDSGECKYKGENIVTVNEWLNGNNNLYRKNKKISIKWINFIQEVEKYNIDEELADRVYDMVFRDYNNTIFIKNKISKKLKEVLNLIKQKQH